MVHRHLWKNCPNNLKSKNIRATGIVVATTTAAEIDLGIRLGETEGVVTRITVHRDRDHDTRGRHRECRQHNRQAVLSTENKRSDKSALGTRQVCFDQVKDSITINSRRSTDSSVGSSVNSINGDYSLHSESTSQCHASTQVFAIAANPAQAST